MRRLHWRAIIGIVLAAAPAVAQEPFDRAMLARIKEEGLQRSHAQQLFLALTDGIGARLTGSPAYTQAARWAQARFTEFGLANVHLEPVPFPRGWSLEKISVEMTSPRYMPLIAYADAWSPSTGGEIVAAPVFIGGKSPDDVSAMAASIKGAIVMTQPILTNFVRKDRPQPSDRLVVIFLFVI